MWIYYRRGGVLIPLLCDLYVLICAYLLLATATGLSPTPTAKGTERVDVEMITDRLPVTPIAGTDHQGGPSCSSLCG